MATQAQKQAAAQDFLSRFKSFNDPGAMNAWNDLAAMGATDQVGFDPHPITDAEGNITGYAAQSTKETGAANGGNFVSNNSGAFPGSGADSTFNWQPPSDRTGNLLKSFLTSGPVLMAAGAGAGQFLSPLAEAAGSASAGAGAAEGVGAGGSVGIGADGVNYGTMFDGTGTNAALGTGNMGTAAGVGTTIAKEAAKTAGAKTIGDKVLDGAGTVGAGVLAGKLLGGALTPGTGAAGDGGFAAGQTAEEARKAGLRAKINTLYGIDDGSGNPDAAAARDAMGKEESSLTDATRGFYDEQLQHDSEKALRLNRFALADRGTLGGSAQIDTENELGRDKTIGATRIQDQVQSALAGLRSGRESERLNATNLVNAGAGEDAVAGAQAGLTRSLQNAQATQHANLTGDLFTGGANTVMTAGSNFNPALLAAYQNRMSSFFSPGAGSARSTPT